LLEPVCHLGTLPDALPIIAEYAETSTALMCRTNGQALRVSERLREHGISHRLQRAGTDQVLPAWMTGLFTTLGSSRPSMSAVMDYLESARVTDSFEPEQAWRLLKRMDGDSRNRNSLTLAAVRSSMARGLVPDELTWQSASPLVVSTIHRAKGLEFDQVIIVDSGDAPADPVEQAEETRLLYVAMTRPRDLVLRLELPNDLMWGVLKNHAIERWVKRHPGRTFRGRRYGMEVTGDDVEAEDPAGTTGFVARPHELQALLGSAVHPGSRVVLTRIGALGIHGVPRYAVEHDGVWIGVTSASFAKALRVEVGSGAHTWPDRVEDVWIDCVESVTGSQAAGRNHNMGEFGVWLRPRIVGLGRFVWPKKGQA
jgi:hypothetical protein